MLLEGNVISQHKIYFIPIHGRLVRSGGRHGETRFLNDRESSQEGGLVNDSTIRGGSGGQDTTIVKTKREKTIKMFHR